MRRAHPGTGAFIKRVDGSLISTADADPEEITKQKLEFTGEEILAETRDMDQKFRARFHAMVVEHFPELKI